MTTSTALPSFVISESERKKQIIKTTDRKVRANYLKGKHAKTITQLKEKSYYISKVSLEIKLKPYSWIKLGVRDIPR